MQRERHSSHALRRLEDESRTPERTLLLLGLMGGWPGAFLAQRTLRHKSSKRAFQMKFWFTVVLNIALAVVTIAGLRM